MALSNGRAAPKQGRDQLAVATEAWLRTVTQARLPNGSRLPGNAYKVADDIGRNPKRGFNRGIFEQTGRLEAWPAIPTIAKATGLSDRTVQRMIKALCEAGCIESEGKGGRHKSNYFHAVLSPFSQTERVTVLTEKGDSPVAERVTGLSPDLTDLPVDKTADTKRESVARATPRSPAGDQEPAADRQDVSWPYRPRRFDNVVQLQARSIIVASPEFQDTQLANPTNGHAPRPKRRTKVPHIKLAASNGRAVGDGHNGSAGKSSRRGGAGSTLIPDDWRVRKDFEWKFAESKGYSVKSTEKMAEEFVAWYQAKGRKSADWFAVWQSWVLRELKLPNGHRPGKEGPSGREAGIV